MKSLIEHFENYLGPIRGGWTKDVDGRTVTFQIMQLESDNFPNMNFFATLGISKTPLKSPVSNKLIRLELFIAAPISFGVGNVPSVLQQVGYEMEKTRRPYLRGDVIGPSGTLFSGTPFTALYVGIPVYFDENFGLFQGTEYSVTVAWLIPITTEEARFVATKGWNAFEDKLVDTDPNLFDFSRPGII